MLNPERIVLEEFMDRHEIADIECNISCILREKDELTSEEANFLGRVSDDEEQVILAMTEHNGIESVMEGLLRAINTLMNSSSSASDEYKYLKKKRDVLLTKSVKDAWAR